MAVISRAYTKILAALLTWLGFTGAVTGCNGIFGENYSEYGSPSATFRAKGVVVSETDDTPIEGIRAVFLNKNDSSDEHFHEISNAVYSSNNGNFNVVSYSFPQDVLYVELTDIDGEENGLFAGKVVEADFRNMEYTKSGGHWDFGQKEINLGTIKMTPDNNNAPE
ncbi:MAG: radical SAM-associated putative lipoprotein [Treponema sp.]|jgi:putative lipoprotein (rSAM/lipoprotein system)|nr:radical SAM-associated putative lipoprotein [Treponema sp.]